MNDDNKSPLRETPDGVGMRAGGSIKRLAAELVELARRDPERLTSRVARLSIREQAELALRLPARNRLELLLHSPKPMRLVRSLPDADLYVTAREIDPTDALPLLALASATQIEHLIDLESWRRDRFDADRCGAWVALLLEAGEPALRRFLRHADEQLLGLLLRDWVRVDQMEYEDSPEVHGHGESEAGSERGFVTPDGYYRFAPSIPEHAAAIRRILQIFYHEFPDRYQNAIWAAKWELPGELEEEALRWRQSRLEEHGFPGWEEALSAYAAPTGVGSPPVPPEPRDRDGLPAARSLVPLLAGHGPLEQALDFLADESRDRVLHGIISLANHILVADASDTGDLEAHRGALVKAGSYIRIGLALREAVDPAGAAAVLEIVPAIELFREGYAEVAQLQRRVRRIMDDGWASEDSGAIELLDSPLRERISGLLAPRPLYFEASEREESGRMRDFSDLREIEESRVAVEMVETLGEVLVDRLGLEVGRMVEAGRTSSSGPRSFGAVLGTVLAWQATRGELRGDPLPPDVTADFLRKVVSRRTTDAEAPERALGTLMAALSERYDLAPRQVSLLEAFGRFCLRRISDECGALEPGTPVDPDLVTCLLIGR
jgi:hypothetical protein